MEDHDERTRHRGANFFDIAKERFPNSTLILNRMDHGNQEGNRPQWGVAGPQQGVNNSPQRDANPAQRGGWGRGPPKALSASAQSGRIRRDNRPNEMRGIKHNLDMRLRRADKEPRGWSDGDYPTRTYVIGLPVGYDDTGEDTNWDEKKELAIKIFRWEQVPEGATFNPDDAGACALFIDMTAEAFCTLPKEIRESGTFVAPGELVPRGIYVVEPEEVCLELSRRPQNWTVRLSGMPPEWGKSQVTRNEMTEMMMGNIWRQCMKSEMYINMESGKESDGGSQYDTCPERIWTLFLRSNEVKGEREVIHPLITPWISISEEGNKRYSHKDNEHLSDATKNEQAWCGMRVRGPQVMESIIEAASKETAELMSAMYHRNVTSSFNVHTFPIKAYAILDGVVPPRNLYGEFDPNLIALRIFARMPNMELGHPASVIKYLADRGLDPVAAKTRNTTIRCPGMKHVDVSITKVVVYGANRITTFDEMMEGQPERRQASIWSESDTMQAVIDRDFRKEEGEVVLSGVPSLIHAKKISIMDDIADRVQSKIEEAMQAGMERVAAFDAVQHAMGGYIDAQVGVVTNTLHGKVREIKKDDREYAQERGEEKNRYQKQENRQWDPPLGRESRADRHHYRQEDDKRLHREGGWEGGRGKKERQGEWNGDPPRPDHEGRNHQESNKTAVNAKGRPPAADHQRKQGSLMQYGQTQYNSGTRSTLKWEEKRSQHPTTQ